MKAQVKQSMAADVWSQSTISLMASMLYFIDENVLQILEVLLNRKGFTRERHTGEALLKFGSRAQGHLCLSLVA